MTDLKLFYLIHFNFIKTIIPTLFTFTTCIWMNLDLELTIPTVLQMNENDVFTSSCSTGGTSNNVDVTGDNSGNIDKPWIDLRLAKFKGGYYVIDSAGKNGVNLIGQLQQQAELVNIKSPQASKGIKLDIDASSDLSTIMFEGKKYQGQYVDLKYSNATITSHNLPIQKNDSGSLFIIWKKVGK